MVDTLVLGTSNFGCESSSLSLYTSCMNGGTVYTEDLNPSAKACGFDSHFMYNETNSKVYKL